MGMALGVKVTELLLTWVLLSWLYFGAIQRAGWPVVTYFPPCCGTGFSSKALLHLLLLQLLQMLFLLLTQPGPLEHPICVSMPPRRGRSPPAGALSIASTVRSPCPLQHPGAGLRWHWD